MGVSETEHLLHLLKKGICPWCGKNIPEGARVGTGRKGEGGFCSLRCYGNYHALELRERARRVSDIVKRHERS
jgi:hypothetical protein